MYDTFGSEGMTGGLSYSMIYWIIFIGIAVLSWLVQMNLQNKFKKYSQIRSFRGLTGKETAELMLADYGIKDVRVQSVDRKSVV